MNTKLKLATSYGVKIPGIYRITNKETHRFYVGKSVNVLGRWIGHYSQEHNPILRNDIEKYGFAGFTFEILEVCEDVKLLAERERFYIETLRNENPDLIYNICIPNSNSKKHNHYNHPLSPEERYRIRQEGSKKGGETSRLKYGKKVMDESGNIYDSKRQLSKAKGISKPTCNDRIKKGIYKLIKTN